MLTINIWARGKEHYAVFYPVSEFHEETFMEKHSENYMDLSGENIDMEMWSDRMECSVDVNGKNVQVDDDFVVNSSIFQGNELNLRQHVEADEADVAIYWMHSGVVEYEFSWNNINDFKSSKIKLHFFEEDVFDYITFDGIEADNIDMVNFEPKYGYEGPRVLFPGDESA